MTRPSVVELDLDTISRALADPHGHAFRELHRRYAPVVRWAVACRVLRWPELASSFGDIVQEVWMHLLRRRRPLLGYDPTRGLRFSAFLALISSRLAWKLAKRRLRHPLDELYDEPDDEDWDFTIALARADLLQRLAKHVEGLDDRSKQFFYGHFVDGRMIKDVGAELGLSDNASHVFKLRLEKKLVALARSMLVGGSHDDSTGGSSGGVCFIVVTLATIFALTGSNTVSSDLAVRLHGDHE